jgi:hypothetical protein
MDTTQLLTQYANAAAVSTAINNHYGGGGCAFGGILSNAWTNYFNIKYNALGYPSAITPSPSTSVQFRIAAVKPKIIDTTSATSIFSSIDSFRSNLTATSASMTAINNLTDPTYGMLAGLNCKLFG